MYQVSLSVPARKQIAVLYRRALKWAMGKAAQAALKQGVSRLQSEPARFGDPLYKLRQPRGSVYHAVCPPFLLHYAIYPDAKVVFVISVFPIPPSKFESD